MTAPEVSLAEHVARLRAEVAALRRERDEAHRREAEALARETAAAKVLRLIGSSSSDIGPVFDAIASRAARLCGADAVAINMRDGDVYRAVAGLDRRVGAGEPDRLGRAHPTR